MKVDYAIVFVRDMSRSVAFYRDVLGMPLRFESSHWTEFGAKLAQYVDPDGLVISVGEPRQG